MITIQMIIASVAGIIFGIIIGFWVRKRIVERQFESITTYSKKIINEAHRKAKTIKKEAMLRAKDTIYQLKSELDKNVKDKYSQIQAAEKRLFHKEENLDKKISQCENRENSLLSLPKGISTEVTRSFNLSIFSTILTGLSKYSAISSAVGS